MHLGCEMLFASGPDIAKHAAAQCDHQIIGDNLSKVKWPCIYPGCSVMFKSQIQRDIHAYKRCHKKMLRLENTLVEHYRVLKDYLTSYIWDDFKNIQRSRANGKLTRLSVVQFEDLSTDGYDELLRRKQVQELGDGATFLLPHKIASEKKRKDVDDISRKIPQPCHRCLVRAGDEVSTIHRSRILDLYAAVRNADSYLTTSWI
ncbi:hypothetical protein K469DRAFT_787583 [Zopfia rhizophila CBS 207.26]|uniref:GIT Spa2 homology (SHD) domain-containing protein n=1 Tax=Zopfia rhizophila CBS 207.26 TaxID=1314779 RepID=A0A6A6DTA1_9PEZI|nr:hypothetical protein K469DRAFT_787583 [Zopfia rhizophila CBS 207.26]